jgi:hypothetical protein
MKVEIPKELKADMPQTTFAKILAAMPVVIRRKTHGKQTSPLAGVNQPRQGIHPAAPARH